MIPSFIITFRETLEAALIVGIVVGYLYKTKQRSYQRYVYYGIIGGVIGSLAGAWLFGLIAGGFSGRLEEIFEGITMILGAGLLTTMILWMMSQQRASQKITGKVEAKIQQANKLGLFLLVAISILREGIELTIFLSAASLVSPEHNLAGAITGLAVALLIGFTIFRGIKKFSLRKIFIFTNILLILFAAGLLTQGIHEFQEAGLLPTVVEHVWDINPPLTETGSYPLLHENGYLGSIFKSLFGYDANPSLLEIITYGVYLVIIARLAQKINKHHQDRIDTASTRMV